ncbi:MAG TPA: galactose-1-phosphate uridylyltransferase [Trebonia sp.]|nr:galactose-1-phosphate uridylyltransferase [Trebonia sp.]
MSQTVSVSKTPVRLADGRELIYFGTFADGPAGDTDTRVLPPVSASSESRYDPLLDEWVLVTGHRLGRTHLPPDTECPLCPSRPGRPTEIPASWYQVAAFQNRFPALAMEAGHETDDDSGLLRRAPGRGRCEVVVFSPDHDTSFASLTPEQAGTVMAAWADRTAELSRLPGIQQVYCFENRGREIGVTLSHPHGQIYAYPFVTPRTSRMLSSVRAYRGRTGRDLVDDMLTAEHADGSRIVVAGRHWTAFVPFAAHWPYEVHLYPVRRVPDLTALTNQERAEFCEIYLDILRRFDRLFGTPAPYIAAWHQAPVEEGHLELALHLELFTTRRAPGKLKYLAGTESGMGAFTNDVVPEAAASRLRELA